MFGDDPSGNHRQTQWALQAQLIALRYYARRAAAILVTTRLRGGFLSVKLKTRNLMGPGTTTMEVAVRPSLAIRKRQDGWDSRGTWCRGELPDRHLLGRRLPYQRATRVRSSKWFYCWRTDLAVRMTRSAVRLLTRHSTAWVTAEGWSFGRGRPTRG
jgi:hypothetical protein